MLAGEVKAKIKGLSEFEDNVSDYMRHKPLIAQLIESAFEGTHHYPLSTLHDLLLTIRSLLTAHSLLV